MAGAGERNAPPEDGGGIPGFYETLGVAADPDRPDHAEAKEWLDDYGPDVFDELPIKYVLGRIANQRNAAKARLAKKKPSRGYRLIKPQCVSPAAFTGWIR